MVVWLWNAYLRTRRGMWCLRHAGALAWRLAGLCARVRACAGAAESLHTYIQHPAGHSTLYTRCSKQPDRFLRVAGGNGRRPQHKTLRDYGGTPPHQAAVPYTHVGHSSKACPNLVPCPNLVLPSLEPPAHTFRALESCRHAGKGLPCCPVTSRESSGAANGRAGEEYQVRARYQIRANALLRAARTSCACSVHRPQHKTLWNPRRARRGRARPHQAAVPYIHVGHSTCCSN